MTPDTITFVDFAAGKTLACGMEKQCYPDYSLEAKEGLIEMIKTSDSGAELLEYCRRLSYDLVRHCLAEDVAPDYKERYCQALEESLRCTPQQSRCLVNLTLELIHFQVHGDQRRANVDLSFLIAMAAAAVRGVGPQ